MNVVGSAEKRGAAKRITPPSRCRVPRTFSVAKYRSATRPRKNGATMAATGLTVYGQCVSVAMPWFVMYTAMDVYQAPQMKNWRNIIVDSLVRITASGCRHREFLRQPDDDMRPRWQDDVRVLGLMGHSGAGGAADDAADDRALLVAAEDATEDRAGGSARSHLRDVTGGGAATFVNRFER